MMCKIIRKSCTQGNVLGPLYLPLCPADNIYKKFAHIGEIAPRFCQVREDNIIPIGSVEGYSK